MKQEIPEPPDAVKNGDGSQLKIWEAVWEMRIHFAEQIASIKSDMRWLGAIGLVLLSAVVGHTLLT